MRDIIFYIRCTSSKWVYLMDVHSIFQRSVVKSSLLFFSNLLINLIFIFDILTIKYIAKNKKDLINIPTFCFNLAVY